VLLSRAAEAAAAAIDADALLVRVGAYYHDVGKTLRPYFFIENQLRGANPHDGLDPAISAQIIIDHVTGGVELARRNGLPQAIVDFVLEHHGTTSVAYFHHQAVTAHGAAAVDEAAFRYPGPRPQSRETAIIMLADSTEAPVRAAEPGSMGHPQAWCHSHTRPQAEAEVGSMQYRSRPDPGRLSVRLRLVSVAAAWPEPEAGGESAEATAAPADRSSRVAW